MRSNRSGRRCVCKGMRRLGTALSVSSATLTFAVGAAVVGLLSTPPSAGAATGAVPASTVITRSAHIAYLSCPEPDVLLTASIQRQPFGTGQPVTYKVSIRNLSHRACGYPNGLTEPTNPTSPAIPPGSGLLDPCGELSVHVESSHGTVVYPAIAVSCPMILGPPLGAGQTITTTGSWDQSAALGYQPGAHLGPVPRGKYRLVIDQKVTLPVDLTGPPFISPPPTVPPRSNPLPPSPVPFQPLPNLPAPTVPSHPTAPSTTPTTPTPAPSTPPARSGHPLTRSAHVAFDGCSARAVTLTVTIPAGPTPSAPVRYDVTVHNGGSTACGEAFRNDAPAARHFEVGPCSSVPARFVNAFGVDVYPGPQVYMCPMFAGPYIAPHTSVSATGTWPGTEFVSSPGSGLNAPSFTPRTQPAPAGKYTLVVDNAVDVPFTFAGTP